MQGHSEPQILVKWKALPVAEASWESPEDFMADVPQFHIEDKVHLGERGWSIITGLNDQFQNEAVASSPFANLPLAHPHPPTISYRTIGLL